MGVVFPFFVILLAALLFSQISARFRVPWVVALILAGIVLGPHAGGVVRVDDTLNFIADIGLIFLMFMAGMETRFSTFAQDRKGIGFFALGTSLLPFATGVAIGLFLGFSLNVALLIGAVFISSSIAVVIPAFEANGLLNLKVGKTAVAGTIIADVASLVLLSLLIQTTGYFSNVPIPIFYLVLAGNLIALRWAIPRVRATLTKGARKHDTFENEVNVVFTILIGTVVLFELLGLHPIIAGFFAGLVLSESMQSPKLKEKIHATAYGVFIPIFFVLVGAKTDISVFAEASDSLFLVLLLISASMLSKIIGGFLGGAASGFSKHENILLGVAGIPQLSTTLAVVFASAELGLLPQSVKASMVVLSMVTTFIAPLAIKLVASKMKE